uniref:Uncharacterized protein n=1 Tax=Cannabis sativa TaxID=3483 RepID=A0A803QS64_CANSA
HASQMIDALRKKIGGSCSPTPPAKKSFIAMVSSMTSGGHKKWAELNFLTEVDLSRHSTWLLVMHARLKAKKNKVRAFS